MVRKVKAYREDHITQVYKQFICTINNGDFQYWDQRKMALSLIALKKITF